MNRCYAPFIAAFALFAGSANVFAQLSFSATNLTIAPGGQQALFVTLPYGVDAPAGGLTIQLLSTDPFVAEVPASTTILANSGGIGFYVTAGPLPGPATIFGFAPGYPGIFANVNVTSTPAPTLAFSSSSLSVGAGSQQSLFVITSPAAPVGGISVALSSSNTLAAQVPLSVPIPAGSTSAGFFVTGVAPGTATITGTAAGFLPITSLVTVTPAVTTGISFNQTTLTVATGSRGILFVTLPYGVQAPAGGLTLTLNSSNPLVAIVPATITIPGTSNGVGFYVEGLTAGTTTITATAPPSFGPITSTVTVN
jgi:hypothetical protein